MGERLADVCKRRHWSMGTKTAVSIPRLVIICGPSLRVVARSALNLALASCTVHVIGVGPLTRYSTGQPTSETHSRDAQQHNRSVNLTIELDREDDGRWIAEVVELPGVMCYGKTRDEAISHTERLAIEVVADRIAHGELSPAALRSILFDLR